MPKLTNWFKDNLLFILSAFLLVFIPLYPKWPLFEAIPGYIVRVRLEDIFVVFTVIIWMIYLLKGKIDLGKNPLFKFILIYLTIGLFSMVSAVFWSKTVPAELLHSGKMFLHWLRRIEYFSLFFILFTAIKNKRQIKILMAIIFLTAFFVSIYGYGQKYLYWPAFSTMNREFSKGWKLYLTEHARVLSTFGGHYDLAAYLMILLPILWSLFLGMKKRIWRLAVLIVLASSFWLLILTASRTSFIAYLAAVSVLMFFWSKSKGWRFAIVRWLGIISLSIIIMLSFGELSDRFAHLLQLDKIKTVLNFNPLQPIGERPKEMAMFLENNPQAGQLSLVSPESDTPPTIGKLGERRRPADVFEDIPLPIGIDSAEASLSGKIATFSSVPRTYSPMAMVFDLSIGIRLDALWPMAIRGFLKNPLLGTGYSSLNKFTREQFTEAESTDNDYLRALGETGILGFLSFYGIIFLILRIVWNNKVYIKDKFFYALVIGIAAGIVGLLVNAIYIDVFEASKVAFFFWALVAILLRSIQLSRYVRIDKIKNQKQKTKNTNLNTEKFLCF